MHCFDFEKYIEKCGNRTAKGHPSTDAVKKKKLDLENLDDVPTLTSKESGLKSAVLGTHKKLECGGQGLFTQFFTWQGLLDFCFFTF